MMARTSRVLALGGKAYVWLVQDKHGISMHGRLEPNVFEEHCGEEKQFSQRELRE
jgi:hypothetical protein